jgi:hypothetical protein
MQASPSPILAARLPGVFGPLGSWNPLLSPAVVEILRVAVAVAVVALSATEAGFTKQVGGSFAGKGETLHVKPTEPAKPPVPVSVIERASLAYSSHRWHALKINHL